MIKYNSGSYGFSILFRVHGSAVYKSLLPSLVSSGIYVLLFEFVDLNSDDPEERLFLHPYPMGALISALTFLLAFRANFSYNRYWEAMTAVHQMHSKWLDVGMELAAFHLQAAVYDARKPPAFGYHPEINHLERNRWRVNEPTFEELELKLGEMEHDDMTDAEIGRSLRSRLANFFRRRKTNRREQPTASNTERNLIDMDQPTLVPKQSSNRALVTKKKNLYPMAKSINLVTSTLPPVANSTLGHLAQWFNFKPQTTPVVTTDKQGVVNHSVQSTMDKQIQAWDIDKPPLFLQEAAHLLSLLSAVAFSTLRNDHEQADSPLVPFFAGAPWPHVDPDAYTADVRKDWAKSGHRSWTVLKYIFGLSRTSSSRTLYNAARPFRVIGGVSDAEIEILQAARGPLAKVALVSMWLQEFISREYLAGSTGRVAPPIISRLYQFTSDGMLGYNQARKVAYIPFPFPHAQITSLFVFVVVGFMPVLMLAFLSNEPFGFVLNLLTVMCFTGLHEVARELEAPFQNVPNDVPLNNFQAQFNESLVQMFSGFHPDAFWEVVANEGNEEGDYPPPPPGTDEAPKDPTTATPAMETAEEQPASVDDQSIGDKELGEKEE